ncbi:luciferase-like monooxygenase [Novosphingobium sp. Rr 2-17]|nr:luciferase-like monooxygenase [Novosphingobium sp. Rr 2-17]
MKLGAFLFGVGHHAAAWRHPDVDPRAPFRFDYWRDLAQKAEAAKFDAVFLADNVALFGASPEAIAYNPPVYTSEPLTQLAALATHTSRIGLIATVSSTYLAPYHVARKFAALDQLSGGRAGWNLVTSGSDTEAANFGLDHQLAHDKRYEIAAEHVAVVQALWDSFDDDPVLADKQSGQFYDPAKLRYIDHKGEHFQVRGPLQTGRPTQGHPVIVQAGSSEDGQKLAAATAELVFTAQQSLEASRAFVQGLKDRAQALGRSRDDLLVLPGVTIYVAPTREEAEAKLALLHAFVDEAGALQSIKAFLDWDLTQVDIDGPPPPPPFTEGWQSRQKLFYDVAVAEKLTVRQLIARMAAARGHLVLVGTPTDVVDELEAWFESGAADGFNILAPTFPYGLDDVIELVLPELRRRGLFREDYEGSTLREHLGLKRPDAGFVRAAQTQIEETAP